MQFTTITFYALFVIFLTTFAFLRKYTKVGMMLYVMMCGLTYYYLSNSLLVLLLIGSGMMSWSLTGIMSSKHKIWRKVWLTAIILIDLFPLVYFKYYNFGIEFINQILQSNFSLQHIILPVGISFYTFQAISHAIDVYRKDFTLKISLLEYMFYLSFFPTIVAGPITRAGVFIPQLRNRRSIPQSLLYTGLWLLMTGVIKKIVFADNIALFTNWIFDDPTGYSGFENLIGALGYTMQIYLDFSGYSDIAIGMAALMGFKLKDNFQFPYKATNLSIFWRKWHISLSTWFRDYLYIPMGGNRKGIFITCLNCLITMLVAGLWHGSTWMFIIWGAIHGLGLIIHKLAKPIMSKVPDNIPVRIICWLITFIYVSIAWVFFRGSSLDNSLLIFRQIATSLDLAYVPYFIIARPVWFALLIISMIIALTPRSWYNHIRTRYILSPWIVKLLLFIITIQVAIQASRIDIAPFIYAGF